MVWGGGYCPLNAPSDVLEELNGRPHVSSVPPDQLRWLSRSKFRGSVRRGVLIKCKHECGGEHPPSCSASLLSGPTRHSSPATSTKSPFKGTKASMQRVQNGFSDGTFYIWIESFSEYQQIFLNVPNNMKIPSNWSITGLFFTHPVGFPGMI